MTFMQGKNSRHRTIQKDPTTFGGIVYLSDFSTYHPRTKCGAGSPTASRIAQDQKFDDTCRKNGQNLQMQAKDHTAQ